MTDKPNILIFYAAFLPGFKAGGPIKSIKNIIHRLGHSFNFSVVTRDRDFGDAQPYSGIDFSNWNTIEGCKVFYLSGVNLSPSKIRAFVVDSDIKIIYLNGFFDPFFTQRVLWAKRLGFLNDVVVCIAPRGEFSKGAFSHKWLKKKIFTLFSAMIGLYNNVHWHASSKLEVYDIQRELPWVKNENISIALNLAPLPEDVDFSFIRKKPDNDELVIVFLSRIVPKKNLIFALDVLSNIKIPVFLKIYGTCEDEIYWSKCLDLIKALPSNIKVEYFGFINPSDVKNVFLDADIFFFPTLGENYGHVIHEALSSGLPVLISDQTPWAQVVDAGVGWALPLSDKHSFEKVINDYWSMSLSARAEMSIRSINFGRDIANGSIAERDHIDMFTSLLIK